MFKEGGRTIHIQHEWTASGRNGSCTSVKGDSGSPVYVKRNGEAFAVGILSGGQDAKGTCPFFFTPVSLALRQYDLALLRS
jgi:V8-like Glu-specific endopeptidase